MDNGQWTIDQFALAMPLSIVQHQNIKLKTQWEVEMK